MSWIDKLEQRVGLRPAPEPERARRAARNLRNDQRRCAGRSR